MSFPFVPFYLPTSALPHRLLAAPGADYAGPTVHASVAAFAQRAVEPAGLAHLRRQIALAAGRSTGGADKRSKSAPAAPTTPVAEEEDADTGELSTDEKKRMMLMMESGNHYEMLGLGHLTVNASDDQIKKAYRKLVLRYHPDKVGGGGGGGGATPTGPRGAGAGGGDSPSGGGADAKTDPLFLAIQKAYDVLSDESRRRAYDSQFEFDDSIPSGSETGDFFALYGPVFERNSRFSEKKPVPKLGGPDDSDERVAAFYKFWFGFESWRDFSNLGEHDTSQAEYREEKRWMERQNKSVVAKAKKTEMARVQDLVNRAYARDPRVLAARAREEEEKKRVAEEKLAAKRAAEEAKRKAEEEAAAKVAAEEEAKRAEAAAAKAAREAEKRTVKRCRAALKRALADPGADSSSSGGGGGGGGGAGDSSAPRVTEADVEFIAGRITTADLLALVSSVCGPAAAASASAQAGPGGDGDPSPAVGAGTPAGSVDLAPLTSLVAAERAKERADREELERARAQAQSGGASTPTIVIGKKEEVEWSAQELSMLAKAVAKFPGGVRNRWLVVANFVNGIGQATPRTPDECIAKAHKMEEEKKKLNATAFAVAMAQRKEFELRDKDAPAPQPVVTVVAPTTAAATAAAVVGAGAGATAQAPLAPTTAPTGPSDAPASATPTPVPKKKKAADGATTAPASAGASGGTVAPPPVPVAGSGSASGAAVSGADTPSAPGDAGPGADASSEAGVWTADQQTALEAALKKYPATLDKNERWKLIAEAVPGKTKKQCVARFKEVREKVLAAKGGAVP
jgi:DnaJ family protein C protein 2